MAVIRGRFADLTMQTVEALVAGRRSPGDRNHLQYAGRREGRFGSGGEAGDSSLLGTGTPTAAAQAASCVWPPRLAREARFDEITRLAAEFVSVCSVYRPLASIVAPGGS
ncbi:MAG: hypothetical protein NTU91_02685, partial [Chloroflexi bacterium]|nr:hypothetical protein [Chloroflexota bacterium]